MQYAKDFTDALQFMWGGGILSPGGPQEIADMLDGFEVTGKGVLDIGSGLGGVDALLVSQHRVGEVVGIDVEPQLVDAAEALIARKGLSDRISFRLVDPGPLPLESETFDMMFSKDAMVHVADEPALFAEVLRVLKAGGAFIAADWLWGHRQALTAAAVFLLCSRPESAADTSHPA
jgi:ubiquinone/menaquinone biosynthesis C-methylase UbiE